jgi:repressor LexA
MNAKAIGARIQKARKAAGITQEAMAMQLGIGVRMYAKYEYGEVLPKVERLVQIADILKVPYQSLLSDKVYSFEEDDKGGLSHARLYKVPVVNHIPAGGFTLGFEQAEISEWVFTRTSTPGAFALRVEGQSMEPKIMEGDIVVIAPDLPFVNGEVYSVVLADSQHTLKRVQRVDGGYLLIPDNPMYEPIFKQAKEVIRLYRVVELSRKL